jgi:hypothetical protein
MASRADLTQAGEAPRLPSAPLFCCVGSRRCGLAASSPKRCATDRKRTRSNQREICMRLKKKFESSFEFPYLSVPALLFFCFASATNLFD